MGRYLKEARHHAECIQYYYDHAGAMGHSQVEYHYFKLSDLIKRAYRSKNDKNDAVVIQSLKESAEHLMEEMKKREEDDMKERQDTGAQHTDSGR